MHYMNLGHLFQQLCRSSRSQQRNLKVHCMNSQLKHAANMTSFVLKNYQSTRVILQGWQGLKDAPDAPITRVQGGEKNLMIKLLFPKIIHE